MNLKYFFESFPGLDCDNIVLREIEERDAQDYYEYMTHNSMDGFLTKENQPKNNEEAVKDLNYWRNLFYQKKSLYWAITLKENDKMIGTAGFNMISFAHSRAEISYDLDPNYWGKGIMSKSIDGILKFAYLALELVRVQATVITDNDRSIKLLEKLGFTKEGFLNKYEVVNGSHKDYYMYSRIAD